MLQRRYDPAIVIRGARQNNLKNLSLEIPTNELVVVTGVSGSGKSSLVFDTLYAEGQRRYVETFSPYARQFLDRMDKPQVDAIEEIPPAIAIDQTNPVRTSRSTVGTMTELNDHLKLLFARAGQLFCRGCGEPVRRDTPDSVYERLAARAEAAGDPRLIVTFPVTVPKNFKEEEVQALLKAQGYDRIHARSGALLEVIQDRVKMSSAEKARVIEGIEAAFKVGQGKVNVYPLDTDGKAGAPWRYSSDLHCPDCDIHYSEPLPSLFSFNSPLGACETCRGFGRVIGIDYGLIVPDESKTLREGAIRPWQSPSFHECQDDIEKYAKKRGVPLDAPFRGLSARERAWVLEGEPEWLSWRKSWPGVWYGVARFFRWLETKAYKMHVRVLLSRYRAYTPCSACGGARLKPEALLWRVGTKEDADRVLDPARRFMPQGAKFSDEVLRALPGLTVHDLVLLPAERTRAFFEELHLPAPLDEATDLLLTEIRARLRYVQEVGLGYLTLDRQSRTLSGGEVQRINLTTALGTSLVNTLFVLDEPSIGLHPRDMGRVIGVMQRLRDAGNSLVVVEHDPQIMFAADRILDMGPGPGERGAELVSEVVLVDQSPIGKTTRSNPASYVGAFDCIRDLFSRTEVSKERRYTAGTFSFNSGNGRCPSCGGNGFEHVEMQFLSDVYLRCPDCDGRRYRAEVLEATLRGKSIADVLDLTVSEAASFFKNEPKVLGKLTPLDDVGLEYLRLGQPVPTLSGGEAQRLKLAGHLAEKKMGSDPILFLFDEPTTGLHFDDVAKLLRAFRQLLQAGHSLVVIEHNLDVIRSSDWILDLGPEGGDAGGELVCEGTPAQVMAHPSSPTGKALRDYEKAFTRPVEQEESGSVPVLSNAIRIHNAREHNLKSIDVEIPRGRFTVVTGVSGSGKSTLAFDILFAEGQRRYLESLNAYARQFVQAASRPDVDAIFGIPPTVAIEQRASRGGRKSTVATLTEVYHFLRLLYVKLGTQYCPEHDAPIAPQSEEAIAAKLLREYAGGHLSLLAPLVVARKGYYTDLAKWAARKGFAELRVDGALLPTARWPRLDRFKEHSIELPVARLLVGPDTERALREGLARALEFGKGVVHVLPLAKSRGRHDFPQASGSREGGTGKVVSDPTFVFSTKRACPVCSRSFPDLDPRLFSFNSKHGWCATCYGTGLKLRGFDADQTGEEIWWNEWYGDDERV